MREKGFAHIFLLIFLLLGLIAGVYLVTSGNPLKLFSKASESDTQKKIINNLTAELLQKKDKYNNLTKSGQVSVQAQKETLDNLTALAIRRKEELSKLIEKDPRAFLDTAKLVGQKDTFPKQVQAYLEEKGEIKGKLTVVHEDDFINKQSKYLYRVQINDEEYSLYFTKNPPPLLTDSVVSVSGTSLGMALAVDPSQQVGNQSLKIVTQALSTTTGEQKTAILLVKFADDQREPYSVSQVRSMMFEGSTSVDSYYRENSSNQAFVSGEVFGWYTINSSRTGCDYDAFREWADKADQAWMQANNSPSGYFRRIYLIPKDCRSRGTLGGFPSRSWISTVNLPDIRIIEHELGHNFGVHHSNAFSCGSLSIDNYSRCTDSEYGEIYDVMGNFWFTQGSYRFNSPHQLALGWIPQSAIQTITTDGTYSLSPLYQSGSGVKVLKIRKRDTYVDWYYLSYRQPTGVDSTLPSGITDGINIHIWDSFSSIPTKFIDTSPADSEGFANASLSDGETFTDSINGITVKQLRHDSTSATLEIKFTNLATPVPDVPTLGSWQTLNSLPKYSFNQPTTLYNGYIFAPLSGQSGLTIHSAKTNGDGTIGSWQSTTTVVSFGLTSYSIAAAKGYLFITGGTVGGYAVSGLYSAKINTDGTLETWNRLPDLPKTLRYHTMVSDGNYLFVIGGQNGSAYVNSVYSAKVNSDGTLGSWQTITSLPKPLAYHGSTTANGYLYVVGGYDSGSGDTTNTVYSAKTNSDGTIGSWQTLMSLPQVVQQAPVVALKDYLFVMGGTSRGLALSSVFSSKLDSTGNVSGWQTLLNASLPTGRSEHSVVADNDYIYVLGGLNSSRDPILPVQSIRVSSSPTPIPTSVPTATPRPSSINISSGDNTLVFSWLPSTNLKADDVINSLNNQGFRVRAISRWDSTGRWITRVPGTPINNFEIRTGEGYWIKNEGNAGVLNLERLTPSIVEMPAKPSPSSFVCTPCTADINKDKKVNISDYSLWAYCRVRSINSSPRCPNADLDKDGRVGNGSLNFKDDPEFKCINSQMGKKC